MKFPSWEGLGVGNTENVKPFEMKSIPNYKSRDSNMKNKIISWNEI